MRILHVVPTYLPATRYGGPIYSTHGLAKAQASLGHHVTVATTNVDGKGSSDVAIANPTLIDGVEVFYFEVAGWGRRLYLSRGLHRWLHVNCAGFDFVHLHSVFLTPSVSASKACRHLGVPYAVSPRGMLVRQLIREKGWLRKRFWLKVFEEKTLRFAQRIHVTSKVEQAALLDLYPQLESRIAVVPNGIEEPRNVGQSSERKNPRDFLFLGRVHPKKGLQLLLEALARVPEAKLHIVGPDDDGHGRELSQRAKELKISHRVLFHPMVPHEERACWFRRTAATVLVSENENFGNVVAESMAAGKPVISVPQVGATTWLLEARAGLVVERDPEKVAQALRKLLAQPASAAEMGARGLAFANANLTWSKVASDIVKCVYKSK